MFSVQWIILKSSLHTLKNIISRDRQELRLRDNIIHCHGNISLSLLCLLLTENTSVHNKMSGFPLSQPVLIEFLTM
jgi:hypothetical protein